MSRTKPSHRKSNGFHARTVNPAPSTQPAPPTAPPPEPARDTRFNALRHGAYAASLDATAAALGEDPAEVAALAAELWACYAPADAQEARIVERLAATWRRLTRLSTHAQSYLRERLAGGATPLFALKESEAASGEEAKLERALLRLHRHLEFLQRWRVAAAQRRAAQASREAQAEITAMLDETHAEAQRLLAEARRRRAEEAAGEPRAADDAARAVEDGTAPAVAERESGVSGAPFDPAGTASAAPLSFADSGASSAR